MISSSRSTSDMLVVSVVVFVVMRGSRLPYALPLCYACSPPLPLGTGWVHQFWLRYSFRFWRKGLLRALLTESSRTGSTLQPLTWRTKVVVCLLVVVDPVC